MATTRRAPTFYTMEEWEVLLQDFRTSGKTKRAWCQETGIALSSLNRWEQRLSTEIQESDGQGTRFVEVAVRRSIGTSGRFGSAQTNLITDNPHQNYPQFTIEYGACRLHMNGGFSEEDLRKAMRVIRDVE